MAATFRDWPDGKAHTISYAQHLKNLAFGGAAQGNAGMGAGSTSALKAIQASNAASPPPAPVAPAQPSAPNPLDSTFASGANGLIFNNKNQRDDLTNQGAQATADFNTMLQRMAEARTKDLLSTNHVANQQGLFYSGQLTKRRDEVETGYKQQEDDQRQSYDRAAAARQAALDRLGNITADAGSPLGYTATGQAGLDLAALFGDATARQRQQDAGGGADLAAAATLPTPGSAAKPSAVNGAPIKIAASAQHGGAKWVYRLGAGGKWIPIRPAT